MDCIAPNFLSPFNFRFVLDRTPTVEYMIQRATVPGMNLGTAAVPTPFVRVVNPGNIQYGDLAITFKIDEAMVAYDEIYGWMESLGHPDNLDPQYKHLRSDGSLVILSSSNRALIDISFTDMYPSSVSPLTFDTTLTDVQYLTCDVTFAFNRMFRKKLT